MVECSIGKVPLMIEMVLSVGALVYAIRFALLMLALYD